MEALAAELRKLKIDNTKLVSANQALEAENQSIKLELQNIKAVMEPDEEMHGGGEQLSDEAARKRLERMCKRNKKGTLACKKSLSALPNTAPLLNQVSIPPVAPRNLQVPESIHEAWKKGGESRTNLQKLFAEAGFQKDWGAYYSINTPKYRAPSYDLAGRMISSSSSKSARRRRSP